MDSTDLKTTIRKHLQVLCEDIGARPTGSEKNRQAYSYIYSTLKEQGWKTYLQKFPCIDWAGNKIILQLGEADLKAAISDYSIPCELTSDFVPAGTVKELESLDSTDKILVLHGELTKEAIMPKSFPFYNPEQHQKIVSLLEEKKPSAVITVSFKGLTPVFEDGDLKYPIAVVSGDTGSLLLRNRDENIYLKIDSTRHDVEAANVIANIGQDRKKIIICAHFDTKPNTPGAIDNATGVTVLLSLAEMMKRDLPDNNLEFVFFNGEDYFSNAGEVTFLNHFLEHKEEYALVINIDGVGLKDSSASVAFFELEERQEQAVHQLITRKYNAVETIPPWYEGDHSIFVMNGLPGMAMTSKEVFGIVDSIIHTPADNLGLIDIDKVAETVCFVREIINLKEL